MNDIYPVKNTIDLPFITSSDIFWAKTVFLFLLIIIALFFAYKYYKKYSNKKNNQKKETAENVDYDLVINEKLKQADKILTSGNYKKFHLEISELLRYFFEKKYNFNAIVMTSSEINKSDMLSNWQKKKIKIFFLKNDEAKFADVFLEKGIAEDVFKLCKEIINHKK